MFPGFEKFSLTGLYTSTIQSTVYYGLLTTKVVNIYIGEQIAENIRNYAQESLRMYDVIYENEPAVWKYNII